MPQALSDDPVAPSFGAVPQRRMHSAYAVCILALITALGVADRSVLSVLLVPIKKDLHASDAAMGALTGISFTLVYATVAFPMARWADTGVRRNIIAGALAIWSIMTAVCGLASSYAMLLVARMGVAAGEASSGPASTSLVGDLVSFKRRGMALGFIALGSAVGTAFGALTAGQITARYGWHAAFVVLGAPGLILAVIFFLTVREPQRGAHDGGVRHGVAHASWWQSVAYLSGIPSFWPLVVANMFVGVSFSLFLAWMPAYLMRVMGLSMSHMSALWSVVTLPALPGVILGGVVSDRLAARGPRWRVYFMALLLVLGVPVYLILLAAHDIRLVAAMMLIYAAVIGPVAAVVGAANLDIVQPRARGMMAAIVGLCSSVLGAGLGPLLIGQLNDSFGKVWGGDTLRHTLITVPISLAVGAAAFIWASRHTDRDAKAASGAG
jgi:predicted MFS family arabinose efflux permease